ncbi:MAG: hypothetical protein R2750_10965 [Bacteroidales bacterium]
MKKSLLIICLFLISGIFIASANNPVVKKTKKGKKLLVEVAIEGSVSLYVHESKYLKATIPEDPMESYTETKKSYFIGTENKDVIQELTFANYKELLLAELIDCPKLADNIGKKGYRFANLDTIIDKHNDQ